MEGLLPGHIMYGYTCPMAIELEGHASWTHISRIKPVPSSQKTSVPAKYLLIPVKTTNFSSNDNEGLEENYLSEASFYLDSFSYNNTNLILLSFRVSPCLVPRFFPCHNFQPTDDPFYPRGFIYVVYLGFGCLCLW